MCVFFTLNRHFYPSTSSTQCPCWLFIYPINRETSSLCGHITTTQRQHILKCIEEGVDIVSGGRTNKAVVTNESPSFQEIHQSLHRDVRPAADSKSPTTYSSA